MNRTIFSLLLVVCALAALPTFTFAQDEGQSDGPVIIALFPLKNQPGEVIYDDLGWEFADSLYNYLSAKEDAGTRYELVPTIDVRDQMLALNVDIKSPSYETDVYTIAEAFEARKILMGTYFMRYGKANIEIKIIDMDINWEVFKTKSIRLPYEEALSAVDDVAEQLYPELKAD